MVKTINVINFVDERALNATRAHHYNASHAFKTWEAFESFLYKHYASVYNVLNALDFNLAVNEIQALSEIIEGKNGFTNIITQELIDVVVGLFKLNNTYIIATSFHEPDSDKTVVELNVFENNVLKSIGIHCWVNCNGKPLAVQGRWLLSSSNQVVYLQPYKSINAFVGGVDRKSDLSLILKNRFTSRKTDDRPENFTL